MGSRKARKDRKFHTIEIRSGLVWINHVWYEAGKNLSGHLYLGFGSLHWALWALEQVISQKEPLAAVYGDDAMRLARDGDDRITLSNTRAMRCAKRGNYHLAFDLTEARELTADARAFLTENGLPSGTTNDPKARLEELRAIPQLRLMWPELTLTHKCPACGHMDSAARTGAECDVCLGADLAEWITSPTMDSGGWAHELCSEGGNAHDAPFVAALLGALSEHRDLTHPETALLHKTADRLHVILPELLEKIREKEQTAPRRDEPTPPPSTPRVQSEPRTFRRTRVPSELHEKAVPASKPARSRFTFVWITLAFVVFLLAALYFSQR